jgi:O-antigen/teichoic acid export membrane protein
VKRTIAKGFLWVSGTMALIRAGRLLAFLALGGLLSPSDFGRFAAIYVVVSGLALFQGFGLGHALICRRERVNEAADTVFLMSALLGIVFFALAWVVSPFVEILFPESGLVAPFRFCAVFVLIRALRTVPARLFDKELAFQKRFLPGLVGSLSYAATAILLAMRGAGVWALVSGEVVSAGLETMTYWVLSPWRPRLRFRIDLARQDLSFGWLVLGGTTAILLFQAIDRVAISRLLGTHQLGLYAFVLALGALPATFVITAFNTVLLPSYTTPGVGAERQRELYTRAFSYAAALGVLFLVGVFGLGRYFLEAAYGQKWAGAVLAFYVLSLLGVFRSFSALSEDLLVALAKPRLFRGINWLRLILAAGGVWFGARTGGITGVALVMTAATVVACVAGWIAAWRLTGVSARDLASGVASPLVAGAVTAGVLALAKRALPPEPSLRGFIAGGCLICVVFGASWLALDRGARTEWARLLGRDEQRGGPRSEVR